MDSIVFDLVVFLNLLIGAGLETGLGVLALRATGKPPPDLEKSARDLLNLEEVVLKERITPIVETSAAKAAERYSRLGDAGERELMKWLARPKFLEEVTVALLLNERPDVTRVQEQLSAQMDAGEQQALQRPLYDFFQEVKRQLEIDPTWGPALREFRAEAQWQNMRRVKSASRARKYPWLRVNHYGFRVVVVSLS